MSPEEILDAVMALSEGMTRPVYRGHAKASWALQSGALRRLREAYGENFPEHENEQQELVDRYHKDQLIMPMEVIDGSTRSDLQRLSILQHQGAATGLLDFTEYLCWLHCGLLARNGPTKQARCSSWTLATRSMPATRVQASS